MAPGFVNQPLMLIARFDALEDAMRGSIPSLVSEAKSQETQFGSESEEQ